MSLSTIVADAIVKMDNLITTVTGRDAEREAKVQGKINELEAWKSNAKDIMQYPFTKVFTVGGDENTYYPVRLERGSREPFKINIQRFYKSPHPASLGTDHSGGLSLTLECCQVGWDDFSFTKIKSFLYAYHTTVARVTPYEMGRMIWLRGGKFEYTIKSDFNLYISEPMLEKTTFSLNGDTNHPYTVEPITQVDNMYMNNILIDTTIKKGV